MDTLLKDRKKYAYEDIHKPMPFFSNLEKFKPYSNIHRTLNFYLKCARMDAVIDLDIVTSHFL